MKKIKYFVATLLCCAFLCSIFATVAVNLRVYADEEIPEDNYWELTAEELDGYSNRTSSSSASPQITVFTHGYDGSASHWSSNNSYTFAQEDGSLIDELWGEIGEENVVAFKVSTGIVDGWDAQQTSAIISESSSEDAVERCDSLKHSYFKDGVQVANKKIELSELNDIKDYSIKKDENGNKIERNGLLCQEDVTKHIFLIFEAKNPKSGHDYVYAQLEYILDVISYRYLQLTGNLPMYNMIAHSRGGITNLQYALAHPFNVASLYSIGTPYNGSDFGGAVLANNYHPFLEFIGDPNANQPGVQDIITTELSESYKSFWNTHYDALYDHIKFKPIGSYASVGFILQCLVEYLGSEIDIPDNWIYNIGKAVQAIEYVIGVGSYLTPQWLKTKIISKGIGLLKNILTNYIDFTWANAWLSILNNFTTAIAPYQHLGVSFSPGFLILDDLFIDLDSQLAHGYTLQNGDNDRRVRLMGSSEYFDGKKSVNNVGIAHNLEAHDKKIIDYIKGDICTGTAESFRYRVVNEDECVVTGLNITQIPSSLVIPDQLDGKTVVGIESLFNGGALDPNELPVNLPQVTSITIPSSVTYVADYAFIGMTGLTTVTFNANSQLEKLGKGAFFNCVSLQNVNLPSSLESIGDFAFANCVMLNSSSVGANVNFIGVGVYYNCSALQAINIDISNNHYSSINGVLFDKEQSCLLAYPKGKTDVTYSLPNSVYVIESYAFLGNTNLQTVNLNNVISLYSNAFAGCAGVTAITAPCLNSVDGIDAVAETAWFTQNSNEFVSLGSVLFKYNGTAASVDLKEYSCIANSAFENNNYLQSVEFGIFANYLGNDAFKNCSNLSDVKIFKTDTVLHIDIGCFDNISPQAIIYVPSSLISNYRSFNASLENISLASLSTDVTYILDGEVCEEETYYYGEVYSIYTPNEFGFDIRYYTDIEFENVYNTVSGEIWYQEEEELRLYLKRQEHTTHNVIYQEYSNCITVRDNPGSYNCGESFVLPEPDCLIGYVFEKWQYKLTNDGEWTDLPEDGFVSCGDIWVRPVCEYIAVSGYLYSPVGDLNVEEFSFTSIDAKLPVLTHQVGTVIVSFTGWYDGERGTGNLIADNTGEFVNRDFPVGTTLYAGWDSYNITYTVEGLTPVGNPSTYSYYDGTVTLGYQFELGTHIRITGWYANNIKYTQLSTDITTDLDLIGTTSVVYELFFNAVGGSACSSMQVIDGEYISIPYSAKSSYCGYWMNGDNIYVMRKTILFNHRNFVLSSTYSIFFTAHWSTEHLYTKYQKKDAICHYLVCEYCGNMGETESHTWKTVGVANICTKCLFRSEIIPILPITMSMGNLNTSTVLNNDYCIEVDDQVSICYINGQYYFFVPEGYELEKLQEIDYLSYINSNQELLE